jgi:hypothetical protein
MTRRIPLLLAAMLLLGCDPNINQAWAKESVERNKATTTAITATLQKRYEAFDPAQLYFNDGGDRAALLREHEARAKAFEQAVAEDLAKQPLVIGYTMTYTVPKLDDPPIHYGLGELTNKVPQLRTGRTIRPEKGKLKVDDKQIGWGFYQIPGKEKKLVGGVIERRMFYPGVEIVGTLQHHDTTLHYSLFMLDTLPEE